MSQNRNLSILADNVSAAGVLNPSGGGLGIATTPANGQIPIGNGTNYTAATLTAGTGIGISNIAGGITVTNTGIGPTVPAPGASGNVMTSDGTAWVSSASPAPIGSFAAVGAYVCGVYLGAAGQAPGAIVSGGNIFCYYTNNPATVNPPGAYLFCGAGTYSIGYNLFQRTV
jgi:hypothetical protein